MNIAESNEPVATNIQRVINEKGLKQLAVAVKAEFSANTFNSMLKGRKIIKPCDALKIASVLGVDMNELYKKGSD